MLAVYLCLSQVSVVTKSLNTLICLLAHGLSMIYPMLHYKEIWVSPKQEAVAVPTTAFPTAAM